MKVVIIAGVFGTRITEESHLRPKSMIEIGGRLILRHIMKLYGAHNITLRNYVPSANHYGSNSSE